MSVTSSTDERIERAIEGLKSVDDPEIGLNVVDLGLIYELELLEEDMKVVCTMTLTTEFCPMGESITANVTASLKSTLPEYLPEVKLTFDPPWNHSMISQEGREFLGAY